MAERRGARQRAMAVVVGLALLLLGGGIALAGGGQVTPMISGACGPTPPATTCVTRWTCDAELGEWVPTFRSSGYACNDNVACTYNDHCDGAGTCVGTTISCASDQCNTRACNGTSTCAVTPKANGTTCSDGSACTQTDTCQAGTCVGGNPVQCSAGQCQIAGSCVPATGQCTAPTNKPNLTSCNDGSACTQTDTCQAGACVGGNLVQCSAGQCQVAGSCVPATGQCSAPTNKADLTTCEDGNLCTLLDKCQSGACVSGSPKSCAASNSCHADGTCNPATGACSDPVKANGTSCSSGNTCTGGEVCTAGNCGGGVPVCTTGACDD